MFAAGTTLPSQPRAQLSSNAAAAGGGHRAKNRRMPCNINAFQKEKRSGQTSRPDAVSIVLKRRPSAMKALCWHGKKDIRCDTVPDPRIEHARDAIVEVTSCAICGSDLHLYDGLMPGMRHGDIMGHEFMGRVVEVGPGNRKLRVGDRVVVPFTICCGECDQCTRGFFSVCERSNRNKDVADKVFGHTTAGLFGYTHLTGGYPGGQAEFVRVPYADVTPVKIPSGLTDDQVLFLGDIFPTGWQAVVQCDIEPTDTVAIWGCGPVGQFCIRSAVLLGARQVIAIDNVP